MELKIINLLIIVVLVVNGILIYSLIHRYQEGTLKEKLEVSITEVVQNKDIDWNTILGVTALLCLSFWLFKEFER